LWLTCFNFCEGSKIKQYGNYKRNNLYRLTISSNNLCNNLIRLGCLPRKTFTCKFPDNNIVPDNLMPHFIRGLMDGDGYISKRISAGGFNPTFTFGIVGTEHICRGVQSYLSEKLILNPNKKLRKTKSIWGMSYSEHKDIVKIFNYLYPENTELFLERKYNKFKEIFNYKYLGNKLSYEESLNK